jgi:DNA invertase Pin-like site-specific DNA recombinase
VLDDGSIWDRETLWLEVERVLRDERNRRRRRHDRGRPVGSGDGWGSGSGISPSKVKDCWKLLNALRKPDDKPISKAAVARALYVSRQTLWRVWGGKEQMPWPPA